jgi:hypothetical protein
LPSAKLVATTQVDAMLTEITKARILTICFIYYTPFGCCGAMRRTKVLLTAYVKISSSILQVLIYYWADTNKKAGAAYQVRYFGIPAV